MQLTVTTIIFGLPTGQHTLQVCLTLPAPTLTVQELIAYKIRQEVDECLRQQRPGLSGESRSPEELTRAALSSTPVQPAALADEIARAQHAFRARVYMVVVNDQRLWHPDDVLTLSPESRVEFIKILPLVGG